MTVPGVSGGSMAMILGIYERIISSIGSFRKNIKQNFLFLLVFTIGGLLGVVTFSKYLIMPLLEKYPMPTSYFFLGAVIGGAPMIFKTAGVKKPSYRVFAFPIMGMIPILLIALIPEGVFNPGNGFSPVSVLFQFIGGLIIAIPFVLPGISVSQVLYMFGIYETLMTALGRADFKTLFSFTPLYIGAIIGTLFVAKTMERAMENHPQATYLVIFGFLLGSVPRLLQFAGIPGGINILVCILTAVAGFFAIFYMQKLEEHIS